MTDLLRRHLAHRLQSLFDRYHVVVWHDNSGALGPVLREVLPSGVEMPAFEGNPLSLRQAVDGDDPWLECKWLLYMPQLPDGVACEWLADFEQGFGGLPQSNFGWALREFFGLSESARLRDLLRGSAARELALRFGRYVAGSTQALDEMDVIFALLRASVDAPAATPGELVLRYLTSEADALRWQELGLLPALTDLVKGRLGLRRHLVDGQPPDRGALARCLIASALVDTGAAEARGLANYLPREDARPQWSNTLAQGLRDNVRRERLAQAIQDALQDSPLLGELIDPLRLARGPALTLLDTRMLELILEARPTEAERLPAWWQQLIEVADARLAHEAIDATNRRVWMTVRDAARLLLRTRQRSQELLGYPETVFDRLAVEYARAEDGDWRLDALYHSIAHAGALLSAPWEAALLAPARQAYHRFVRDLTGRFVHAAQAKGEYAARGFMRQRSFWSELVGTKTSAAVLLIDALRADLAHQLGQNLQARGLRVEHKLALAELPTRTEVGMVALLPRGEQDFCVEVEQGRLISSIERRRVPDAQDRVKYLERVLAQQGIKVRSEDLDTWLKRDRGLLGECRRAGTLAVAATTDLDDSGEIAASVTFELFGEILGKCAAFAERALAAGYDEVVVSGDHGFLVRDPDASPGGAPGTASAGGGLARGLRFAAGVGDIGKDLIRLPASMLGRAGVDVYVPKDTAYLATQGGPRLFAHGGLSPQECALVFLRITRAPAAVPTRAPVALRAPEQVTVLAFPVTVVIGAVDAPLLMPPLDLSIVARDHSGRVVWELVESLSLRAATSEVTERVTVSLPRGGEYVISVVDRSTGGDIASRAVRVDVLGDDFTF